MVKRVLLVAIITGILALADYVWFMVLGSKQSLLQLLAEVGGVFIYAFVRYGNEHYPDKKGFKW